MHSIERNKQISEVDLFLFGGATEVPEGDWERDTSVNPHSPTRVVRREVFLHGDPAPESGTLTGTLIFNRQTKKITYRQHNDPQA